LSVHSLRSGEDARRVRIGRHAPYYAIHPDGRRVAVGNGNGVQVWDLDTGSMVFEFPQPGAVIHLTWSPDGMTLAGANNSQVYLSYVDCDRKKYRALHQLTHVGGGLVVGFDPSGELLFSGSDWVRSLRIWHARTGKLLLSHASFLSPEHFKTTGMLVTKDGVESWEVATGREYRTLTSLHPEGSSLFYPTIAPDGRLLAVGRAAGISFWDLELGSEVGFLAISHVRKPVFEMSGSLLVKTRDGTFRWTVQSDSDETIHVGPYKNLGLSSGGDGLWAVSSRDGRVVAQANGRGADVRRAGEPMRSLGPQRDVRTIAVSPDGRWVATVTHNRGETIVWNVETGQKAWVVPGTSGEPMFFSPDNRWLASNGWLWSVGSWERGSRFGDIALAFTPKGEALASVTTTVLRLLETRTCRELARFEDPNQDNGTACTFSPDGTRLVTTNNDNGTVHIWDLRLIRESLARMGLDWDQPPYPEPEASSIAERGRAPLRLTMETREDLPDTPARQAARLRQSFQDESDHLRLSGRAGQLERLGQVAQANFEELLARSPGDAAVASEFVELLRFRLPGDYDWTVLDPIEIRSEEGATLTKQPDQSILVSGLNPDHDTFTVVTQTALTQIRAFRLEVFPDASLPAKGPGRGAGGQFSLSRFQVQSISASKPGGATALPLADVAAEYSLTRDSLDRVIGSDNDAAGGWSLGPNHAHAHPAWFTTAEVLDRPTGASLTFRLAFRNPKTPQQSLGRFRLSAATRPDLFRAMRWRNDLNAKSMNPWTAEGAVSYFREEWAVAKAALDRAIAAPDGGSVSDRLLLALAHARLGDRGAARRWFHQAVVWQENHPSQRPIEAAVDEACVEQIERSPADAFPWLQSARWHDALGRRNKAADELARALSIDPSRTFEPFTGRAGTAPGLIEGEALRVLRHSSGRISHQATQQFGTHWSGDHQLLWTSDRPGSTLSAVLFLRVSGEFEVSAAFTRAPDHGIAQLSIDGEPLITPGDLFSPVVSHSGGTALGRVSLAAGSHALEVTMVGKKPESTGYKFGLDWIELTPVR
jgi:WD40 repeat protein